MQALLCLPDCSCGVGGPGEVVCCVSSQEFEAVDSFHTVSTHEDGRGVSSALPEVQDEFFCLPCVQWQVVCGASQRQSLDLISVGGLIIS